MTWVWVHWEDDVERIGAYYIWDLNSVAKLLTEGCFRQREWE